MIACAVCSCPGHAKRAVVIACADPARCWQWDHSCFAKRMRRSAARVVAPVGPASLAGRIVPNVRLAVAA